MPSLDQPFRVPDTTPVCDRLALLERLAREGTVAPSVRAFAAQIAADVWAEASARRTFAAPRGNWYAQLLAQRLLDAVQRIPYVPDPAGQEWFQPAAYTLAHGGDCEEYAVVFTAAARLLGLRAEPDWITQEGKALNHVSSRVWLDGDWVWAEGSIQGARLGESPYSAIERLGHEPGHHGVAA